MRIAVASMAAGGLDDTVSPVFEASPSFTLVDAADQEILSVTIVVAGNAAEDFSRDLVDRGVDIVVAGEFGPEAAGVFSSAGIDMNRLQGMPVEDAVKQVLNRATDTVRGSGRGIVPIGYTGRAPDSGIGFSLHRQDDRGLRRPPVT